MNNIFGDLSGEGLEQSVDRVGGDFGPFETGAYTGKVKHFYQVTTKKGGKAAELVVEIDGREYRQTLYLTSTKTGGPFWLDKQGKKQPMGGFTIADELCLVTTGKPLNQQPGEMRVVTVREDKKNVNKEVPTLIDVIGKEAIFCIVRQTEVSQSETAPGSNVYVDAYNDDGSLKTRDRNEIEKVVHLPSNLTVPEARNGIKVPTFLPAWKERNTGVTRDKTKGRNGDAGQQGAPKAPPAAASTGSVPSLF